MSESVKIELLGQRGEVEIWSVDGTFVRKHHDIEFTNYGQHYRFPFIPKNEVWIDKEATPDETEFFITHLLVERRLMQSGVPFEHALTVANAVEHAERMKSGDVPLSLPLSPESLEAIHVRPLATLPSGVVVWLVDGRKIRSGIYTDFTEGGHEFVYKFVPPNEIWIDNDLMPKDIGFVLAHEWIERKLMAKGQTYDQAHKTSSAFENELRTSPNLLEYLPALIEKGDVS